MMQPPRCRQLDDGIDHWARAARGNAEAAARYLRWLGERYDWDAGRMLVGYNAGPLIADGRRPVPTESRKYVAKVIRAYGRRLAQKSTS